MKKETILKLRQGQSIAFFPKKIIEGQKYRLFVRIALNKKESFICWKMSYSIDKVNWIIQNEYLSLKDIKKIIESWKS